MRVFGGMTLHFSLKLLQLLKIVDLSWAHCKEMIIKMRIEILFAPCLHCLATTHLPAAGTTVVGVVLGAGGVAHVTRGVWSLTAVAVGMLSGGRL